MWSRCLAEFLKWSIKQATKRQAANSAVNVAALMKRLTMLGRHPRAYLRLGGARAFNYLYTTFREVRNGGRLPFVGCRGMHRSDHMHLAMHWVCRKRPSSASTPCTCLTRC